MKPYLKYKDSGVEWIGEVPEGWDVKPLKYVAAINEKTLTDKTDKNYQFYYIDIGNVTLGKIAFPKKKTSFESAPSRARRLVEDGDTIISTVRTYLKAVANINIDDSDIVVSTGFAVVSPKFDYDKKYFSHLLTCEKIIYKICSLSVGISYPAVNSSDIANIQVWYPVSKEEQTVIATFLDRKTAEIDKLIANKERLIELYEEKKQAVINQAVTKGLDPDAEMKDSGVEWLGEIPAHWEVKRLRYIGDCQNGVSKSGDYFGAGFPFISYGDVYNKFVLPEQPEGLASSTESDQKNYSVVKGDVLFTRTSETMEEIGIASTCLKTIDQAVFSGFLIRFRPIDGILLEGFSKYYFRANIHRLFFVKEMNLVTRASLSQELLKRLPVLIPPIQVQEKIVSYLDQQETNLNSIINKLKKQINLFKEYRTALISEAVTGKIQI
ncbi:MAG: restriction endonuclease subunit S [Candidatus Electrothrix sp. AW3_4]|nr:restriction endonuclease subunit S [Candidatus Electrothrix gigas]